MKAMKYILASALCKLVSTACSGTKKSNTNINESISLRASSPSTDMMFVVVRNEWRNGWGK